MTAATVVRTASLVTLFALGCASPGPSTLPPPKAAPAGAADRVYRLLGGRFDSADQARSSPGFSAIQVAACPADVPALGPGVLYVEQAPMDAPDQPDRQRVYVIEPGEPVESAALVRVFELAVPGSSVGACGLSVPPRFTRDELVERVGCTVALHADGPVYRGTTSGRGCPTTLKGATYVTGELVLDTVGFRSWERGFDPSGTQRWGAESGPYVFVRRTPLPAP
ncbi:MAG TPA: chromophore lyase CpcT/CpeT [Myxococcaceae bacterium]|nr:chromophore lyase CpcT/CpeT [Myxococcaceae bacterium]